MKVEVAVLGSPSLMMVLVVVSVDVPYHAVVASYLDNRKISLISLM